MDLAALRSSIRSLPRAVRTKDMRPLGLRLLEPGDCPRFTAAYLAFQPRNSFQGLPPLKDVACLKWIEQMIATGVNVLAEDAEGQVVGHTALFPINRRKCEMLVVVWPEFQNIGVGTELTRTCVEIGREMGFQQIWLPVAATNLRARHVYRKCGFQYVAGRPSRELEMLCELSPAPTASAGGPPIAGVASPSAPCLVQALSAAMS